MCKISIWILLLSAYYRLLNKGRNLKHSDRIDNQPTKMFSFSSIECKMWTVKQQYVLLLPILLFMRVLLNEWGPTSLYCYAIPVYESIQSVIQLIYLIYRHEPRKLKHENIKITHYDEWWIWWWCNKTKRQQQSIF